MHNIKHMNIEEIKKPNIWKYEVPDNAIKMAKVFDIQSKFKPLIEAPSEFATVNERIDASEQFRVDYYTYIIICTIVRAYEDAKIKRKADAEYIAPQVASDDVEYTLFRSTGQKEIYRNEYNKACEYVEQLMKL